MTTDRRALFSTALEMAEAGDSAAMADVGNRYLYGLGVPKDGGLAVKWLKLAAKHGMTSAKRDLMAYYYDQESYYVAYDWAARAASDGNIDALFMAGHMLNAGQGVKQDYWAANDSLEKAYQMGSVKAAYQLAGNKLEGRGGTQDLAKGVRLMTFAAERGHVGAQLRLGYQYYIGEGVDKDYTKAREWLTKAAAGGDKLAPDLLKKMEGMVVAPQYKRPDSFAVALALANAGDLAAVADVGKRYMIGDTVEKDEAKAIEWFLKGANKGSLDSLRPLVTHYFQNKQYDDAYKWAALGAKQNDSASQIMLGLFYFHGMGPVAKDMVKGHAYFKQGADQGHSIGLFFVGNDYTNGDGVAKNVSLGIDYLKKAARLGVEEAQLRLGYLYYTGDVVEKDYAEAKKWISDLRRAQHPLAVQLSTAILEAESREDLERLRNWR